MTSRRSTVGLILALLVAALVWWSQSGGGSSPDPAADPASGLPVVATSQLPPEALDTMALIDAGGPYPYDQDDGTFGNYEGLLPQQDRGYYREYTVETPGSDDRGARRIIVGSDGKKYWTDDHYVSFALIEDR